MSVKQKTPKNTQTGFAHALLVIPVVMLVIISYLGWSLINRPTEQAKSEPGTSNEKATNNTPARFIWQQTDGGWKSMETPPACQAQPMMKAPADLALATAVLYPGQTRGGNYKPHGGFRFDNSANADIKVTAPIDGFIVRGGNYLAEGEIQYTFDVMNNCGVMYRVGHFRALPESLQKIADTWPAPQEGDSRTHQINPAVYIEQGSVMATSVGIIGGKNTFFDWGVYDYREQNAASKSPAYQQLHAQDKELSWHAVCWFDWLPKNDASRVKGLPAGDPMSGKTSDYCK